MEHYLLESDGLDNSWVTNLMAIASLKIYSFWNILRVGHIDLICFVSCYFVGLDIHILS